MTSTTRNWLIGLFSVLAFTVAVASANDLSKSKDNTTDVAQQTTAKMQGEDAQLQWSTDLQSAFDKASGSNKLLLVDVGAPWCGWCRKMDESTYTDKAVSSLLSKDFVCVKLNSDDNAAGAQFAQRMGIDSLPTVMIVDPKSKKYSRNAGYLNASDFISLITQTKQQLAEKSSKPSM